MTESSNEKMVKLTCPMDDCQWQYDSMFSRDQSFKIINMHFDSVHNQQAQQQVNTAKAEEKGGNGSTTTTTIIRQPNIVHTENDEILVKKNLFIQSLCGHLRQLFVMKAYNADAEDHERQLMSDLLDLQDRNIIDEIRNNLESHHFVIWFGYNKVGVREGFIHFLQQFTTNIELLHLNLTEVWSDDDKKRLFQSLQRQSKIGELGITMQNPSPIPSIDDVISILPQLTNNLVLAFVDVGVGDGGGVDVGQREFCEKLKEGIKMFDTTKLQTQELNVKVGDKISNLLLHVVLSRGEAARIIESKF